MSKVRDRLVEEIRERFGMDCGEVIDYLYSEGMTNDVYVRMFVVRKEVHKRYTSTDLNITRIHAEVGEEFGLERSSVAKLSAPL